MALIDRMTALNARLTSIPVRLGVPQHKTLLIRHVELDDDLLATSHTDALIEPKPYITQVPAKLVGLEIGSSGAFQSSSGITISQEDYQVTGIPRSYSLQFLQENVDVYVIDPPMDALGAIAYDSKGNPASGDFCKLLTVMDKELLTWTLILRKVRDHYVDQTVTVNY
ncbi:hypothetical protein IQ268_08905 [Oculatella sp. LEGE 06141]|uniref:hypothetical protein n=1 Tax=Oculatella sp. LEGE 06141 TaxID=1828648 RepID=UPI00187E7808|nr:hypothetical protein [Oculatella sp. LEGE 06141]MBE9178677.1 hypothetical protein [Oculatella sp. LEGE 06141]